MPIVEHLCQANLSTNVSLVCCLIESNTSFGHVYRPTHSMAEHGRQVVLSLHMSKWGCLL